MFGRFDVICDKYKIVCAGRAMKGRAMLVEATTELESQCLMTQFISFQTKYLKILVLKTTEFGAIITPAT